MPSNFVQILGEYLLIYYGLSIDSIQYIWSNYQKYTHLELIFELWNTVNAIFTQGREKKKLAKNNVREWKRAHFLRHPGVKTTSTFMYLIAKFGRKKSGCKKRVHYSYCYVYKQKFYSIKCCWPIIMQQSNNLMIVCIVNILICQPCINVYSAALLISPPTRRIRRLNIDVLDKTNTTIYCFYILSAYVLAALFQTSLFRYFSKISY